jgi:site-specific recombinase XerD
MGRVRVRACCHFLATHQIEAGRVISTIQELLGHKALSAAAIYAQVLNWGGRGVRRLADNL